ncbi:GNAT family N-acetyltransferase [Aureimonas populi]|uniref:GNAT family N-acetyltransferase n=1 Tax=Aureimonas populi TaxID=1701758 RepID=A0ABW5CIS1_9HYPH|nr:GNAT family N-acetyltransferase [Aureimonas populi]
MAAPISHLTSRKTPPAAPSRRRADALAQADLGAVGGVQGGRRTFCVYGPQAAFELADELDFLVARAVEPNVFFAPQFMLPAMPRLDDRPVRLLVARDEDETRSRLRLVMPFTVERAGLWGGPPVVRAWAHPFGPLGTVLFDGDDPAGTASSLFRGLTDPGLGLPPILVLPDMRLDGATARTLVTEAKRMGLPHGRLQLRSRAALSATGNPEDFLKGALSGRRRREMARQRRLTERRGTIAFDIARSGAEVAPALEEFLSLEASGWKGRERSALLSDRYRAAFARESINGLAARGAVRIFTLRVDARPVASVVALVMDGEAVLWKMAYDEAFSSVSPGFHLIARASQALIADPAVLFVDSCAVPDHSLMNRLWRERVELGTLVIGLKPESGPVDRALTALRRAAMLRQRIGLLRRAARRLLRRDA